MGRRWNYTSEGIIDLVWSRADAVVWLDLSRAEATRRVVSRTFRRLATSEQLWNGNKEGWLNVVDPRPGDHVILWSWTRHTRVRAQYENRFNDRQWSDLELVRLRDATDVEASLADLPPSELVAGSW